MSSLVSVCLLYLVINSSFDISEHEYLPEYLIYKYNIYKMIFNTFNFDELSKRIKKEYPQFSVKELIDVWNYKHNYLRNAG